MPSLALAVRGFLVGSVMIGATLTLLVDFSVFGKFFGVGLGGAVFAMGGGAGGFSAGST